MNQKALALKLNISIPAYSKLETDITDPNYSRIIQIAKVHGLTLKELLEVGEEKSLEATLIDDLRAKVQQLDGEVIKLQRKLIEMYAEQDERRKV
jgi:transcriptional regulator with XRE-family HTH domain